MRFVTREAEAMAAPKRFDDEGTDRWAFADRVDVRCPRCGAHAVATARGGPLPARVVCDACPYAVTFDEVGWLGPMRGRVRCRCERCGQWVSQSFDAPRPPASAMVRCACGHAFEHEVTREPIGPGPVDPTFGLPLWCAAPFRGEVLWAYNVDHLRFLRRCVEADLRQRVPNRNGSLVSRLPSWMKEAGNRGALLALVDELIDAISGDDA